jgi:nitrogenase molybdenum-iron protein alpha/beta subunit
MAHYRIFAKIEGHGSIATSTTVSKKGGLVGQVGFTPTPNFHIHRSGIVMCGTLYFEFPTNNLNDYQIIKQSLAQGKPVSNIRNYWVEEMNRRQIMFNIQSLQTPGFKESFIRKYGEEFGNKVLLNVLLGSEMARQGIPGVLTESNYGETPHTLLADKVFSGRQAGDLVDQFIPETTLDGPALYIFCIENVNTRVRHLINKGHTLPNMIKMTELPRMVKMLYPIIKDTDVVDFDFLDTSCNYNDIRETCSTLSLITQVTKDEMVRMYREQFKQVSENFDPNIDMDI